MSVTLSTIGSAGVEVDATAAALPEAAGGVTLWFRYGYGQEQERSYTFTVDEAKQLVADVARVLTPELFDEP